MKGAVPQPARGTATASAMGRNPRNALLTGPPSTCCPNFQYGMIADLEESEEAVSGCTFASFASSRRIRRKERNARPWPTPQTVVGCSTSCQVVGYARNSQPAATLTEGHE